MLVTVRAYVRILLEVGLLVVSRIRPNEPSNILFLSALEVSHAPLSVCENDDAW